MAFFPNYRTAGGTGRRLTGMARFTELLDRDFKRFFLTNLVTIAGFLPFFVGTAIALLSSSLLILIPSCIIGGILAGPSLSLMYDTVYRSLRDAPGRTGEIIKKAWKQNMKQSILPGILLCLLLGFYLFMFMMFWWAASSPSLGTICVAIAGLVILSMFFTVFWPQIVLFEQSGKQCFRNTILFIIRYFWKTLGCAVLHVLYWGAFALFLPWSVVLLPLTGFWLIQFISNFLLYRSMDEAFRIEEAIEQTYPEQAAYYEDDQAWLKRKQEENNS